MARVTGKLTAKTVSSIKHPGYFSDGGGLYLQVSQSLSKSWLFIYKRGAKKTELGLGAVDGDKGKSLSDARLEATRHRDMLRNGVEPKADRRRAAKEKALADALTITFRDCATAYIEANRSTWKNPKHIQQWENTLAQYCFPIIGGIPVSEIDTPLVLKCLDPIWYTKNETATRVRGRIEVILSYATGRGYRAGLNPARWKGNLDGGTLKNPKDVQKATTKHHAALPYADIGAFMAELRKQEGNAARCLEFTILTAARTGEAIGANWREVDLTAKVWTVPASRMKMDTEHSVPLSGRCMEILGEMLKFQVNGFVFPGQRAGLSNMAMAMVLRRMGKADITVHGFRSTFRDWIAEETGYQNIVAEMSLAHAIKDGSEKAYRRGDLFQKRVLLMRDWGKFCNQEKNHKGNVESLYARQGRS